jgi:hypothetical protein
MYKVRVGTDQVHFVPVFSFGILISVSSWFAEDSPIFSLSSYAYLTSKTAGTHGRAATE